ncbi:MAG: hypothetical protein OXG43_10205, partial [Chloroflexi bacterium]|nr:hypothetical protein [Chloroflexota bacterium]
MSMIERDLGAASVVHLMRLRSAGLELVELTVASESAAAGASVSDLQLEQLGARVAVVLRGDDALFTFTDLVLRSGDTVVAVVDIANEGAVRSRFDAAHF